METVKRKREKPECPKCGETASCIRDEIGDWHKYVGLYILTCSECEHEEEKIRHEGAVGYPDDGSVCPFCHAKH